MNAEDIRQIVEQSTTLKTRFFSESSSVLLEVGGRMARTLLGNGRVLAFGNGGSAADAQHLVAELVGHFHGPRRALSAVALGTDPAILTSVGNDVGFEAVFRRQVEALGRPGDVAIGISTSGRSANVIEAARAAKGRGLVTVGLTGRGGGALAGLVDHLIDVPHEDTARIQEVHGMVVHVLCQIVEEAVTH